MYKRQLVHNEKLHQDIDLEGQEGRAVWCWKANQPKAILLSELILRAASLWLSHQAVGGATHAREYFLRIKCGPFAAQGRSHRGRRTQYPVGAALCRERGPKALAFLVSVFQQLFGSTQDVFQGEAEFFEQCRSRRRLTVGGHADDTAFQADVLVPEVGVSRFDGCLLYTSPSPRD